MAITMEHSVYNNPLTSRYASKEMSYLLSEQKRIGYFRRLWLALAKGEKSLGLNITDEQIAELEAHLDDIDFETANEREKLVRHDVMAHIYTYGLSCPDAAPIIHLGATSCYVTDNADLLVYRESLSLVTRKLKKVMSNLADFALKYKKLPTLGRTHYQPAQLTTVGKRAAEWLMDFLLDYRTLENTVKDIMFRGVKGATGTQASFMTLFDNDGDKVKKLEKYVTDYFGFSKAYPITGQTYTRKTDYTITSALSMLAQSAYKFSMDLRLLQSIKEIEEPFESGQVGSSAMAYKRNPMRSERISSLSRYLISLPVNAAMTAAIQGFERTLDDSANRRIVMGQAFLTADAILELLINITGGLTVYEKVIAAHVKEELPFIATEFILMECVKAGGSRQEIHEKIRIHSMEAEKKFRNGEKRDLIERLKADSAFSMITDYKKLLNPKNFIGRAAEQTDEFIKKDILPLIKDAEKIGGNILI